MAFRESYIGKRKILQKLPDSVRGEAYKQMKRKLVYSVLLGKRVGGINMENPNRRKAVSLHREVYNCKKNILCKQLKTEQKILEDMIAESFAGGKTANLGTDIKILKQSSITDRIIVDRMKLDEMYARHKPVLYAE